MTREMGLLGGSQTPGHGLHSAVAVSRRAVGKRLANWKKRRRKWADREEVCRSNGANAGRSSWSRVCGRAAGAGGWCARRSGSDWGQCPGGSRPGPAAGESVRSRGVRRAGRSRRPAVGEALQRPRQQHGQRRRRPVGGRQPGRERGVRHRLQPRHDLGRVRHDRVQHLRVCSGSAPTC